MAESFFKDFHNQGGLSAEQFFYKQVFDSFSKNIENQTLPFFNKDLDKIPRELSTGKIINNENSIALEQVASQRGYKSNLWIYGDELEKLQKEVGNLYIKKDTQPVLCLTKYFDSTHSNEQDLYISEGGSGKKEQYLYNLDSLHDKSREKVMKYFEIANEVDKTYTQQNLQAFQKNAKLNAQGQNEALQAAKTRALTQSQQSGLNLASVTQCQYLHNLGNSIGKPEWAEAKTQTFKSSCYETCSKLAEKVKSGELKPYQAGKALCTALNAGTEFQRVSVAKNYNLENAKKIEEMKVAEANRQKAYRRSNGIER